MATVEELAFGTLLKRHRAAAGVTQQELAERAGISIEAISALERGVRRAPHRDTVRQLADALTLAPQDRGEFEAAARLLAGPGAQIRAIDTEEHLPTGRFLGALPPEPIVAREEELERILFSADVVEGGTGRLVLVTGETGVGRTRLAQEVMLQLCERGFAVATGRCYEQDVPVPLFPFQEALDTACAVAPSGLRLQVLKRWPHLEHLLPEQLVPQPRSGDAGSPLDQEEHHHLFRQVTGFLVAIAQDRPLALMLDDLQWADPASLALLHDLAHHTRGHRILLLCTYREVEREHALSQVVRDLVREGLAERVVLRRLTLEGTASLVALTLGMMDGAQEFVDFVHRRSKGNPYFVEKMLHALGGQYRLVRQIGAGGMGRVFEAIDTRTVRRVAAKIMFARTEADPKALQRFEQEGAVLATLEHANIVDVYDAFVEEHASCIVMELLGGQSLGRVLSDGHVDLARTKHLMQQVAAALECAHEHGIVHRDIKPDNIMILEDDHVKVTDFGIARLMRPVDAVTTMTSTGMTMGTPHYMAPEQIEGKKVDGRADIYSLGCVLYQMVTDRPPFEGDDPLTVAIKHVREAPRPPSSVKADVPEDWEAMILRMLAKDPAYRIQTASALRAEMRTLSDGETTVAAATAPSAATQVETPGQVRPWKGSAERIRPLIGAYRRAGRGLARPLAPINRLVKGRRGPATRVVAISGSAALLAAVVASTVLISRPWSSNSSGSPGLAASVVGGSFAPWGSTGFSPVAIRTPNRMGIDARGNVYLTEGIGDPASSDVLELSPNGRLLARLGRFGKRPGEFNQPSGMDFDRWGNIYVADYGNDRIQKLSPGGRPLARWGSFGSKPGQFSLPAGVALNRQGDMYVADSLNNRIQKLSPEGRVLAVWGTCGTSSARLCNPTDVAVDADGNILVVESSDDRIQKFSPAGKPLSTPVVFSHGTLGAGMAIDSQGNIYVAELGPDLVQKFTSSGRLLATLGGSGSDPGQFYGPPGVAVDGSGSVYATDQYNKRVQKFSPSGAVLAGWVPWTSVASRFDHPLSVTSDRRGHVYVVTGSSNNTLVKLSDDGRLLARWGAKRLGVGAPYVLAGTAVDAQGNVYVADELNSRIYKLSSSGRMILQWGREGSLPGQMNGPSSLAVDATGNVYVADAGDNQVQKFSATGRFLFRWGTQGSGGGRFSSQRAVAVDAHGTIYVAETGNDTIQKFSASGEFLLQWGTKGSGPGQFLDPVALAVDGRGNVYVADALADRVQAFTPDGKLLARWGVKGAKAGQFADPNGILVDAKGNIYVADTDNNRLQRLSSTR